MSSLTRKHLCILLFLSCAFFQNSVRAQHTFSICAVDTLTGEVGSAGASCIDGSVVISDVFPGFGVVHTQAAYISFNQIYAEGLMADSLLPQQIIDSLITNDAFGDSSVRQY